MAAAQTLGGGWRGFEGHVRGKLWAWSMYTPGRKAQTAARLAQPRVQMLGSHQAPPAGASPAPTALNLPSTLQWNTALDAVR